MKRLIISLGGALVTFLAAPAAAQTAPPPEAETAETEGSTWKKSLPVSLGLEYTLATDYIFRGINFSEYPGEGREKPNHQLESFIEGDTPLGTIGGSIWLEWYAGQERLTPTSSRNHQETDYILYWTYAAEPIGTTVELGWVAYEFPRLTGGAQNTYEVYGTLSFDDTVLLGYSVFKPFASWVLDYDLGDKGSWIEVGLEPEYAVSDVPSLAATPILKDLTISPSVSLGYDYRYLHKFALRPGRRTRTPANLHYGLAIDFDVTGALGAEPKTGTFTVGGFINYSQALRRDILDDELYGGATVAYSW